MQIKNLLRGNNAAFPGYHRLTFILNELTCTCF
jgi:hypothetical protein